MIAEPVHMIEQHKAGDLPVVLSQEAFDGVGLDGKAIEATIPKFFKVMGFEVFRAAVGSVGTGDVDSPEIIVLQRYLGEYGID